MLDGTVDRDGLVAAVIDRAHFTDAADLVEDLSTRGLLDVGRLTAVGRECLATVQASVAADTGVIFDELPADDVAATERILNQVVDRARVVLERTA